MPKKNASASKQRKFDYKAFSQLAGKFASLPKKGKPYKVQYRRLTDGGDRLKAFLLIIANLGVELAFVLWLFQPAHITFSDTNTTLNIGIIVILVGIIIIEAFRLINMFTLCLATLVAKNPVPVRPQPRQRVAFTTAIVPSKEPFEMVAQTLRKAKQISYDGTLDVWLLDEGNVPEIKAACEKMGVHHFSRKGIERWNAPSGAFKAKTKHGNHNAWLDEHGDKYDFVLSVDSDHVPMPNFAQRMLGYFRDPDVAFVVGPQVYGNYDNMVTKGAESQAYLFQAAIQRAGNAYDTAMFVGTNHAFRVKAWKEIGGFQDSITEDMLTSLVVHASHNPATGNSWKSVYTPDVVAVGEGPSSWTDFFSQQLRWARGSNEVFATKFLGLSWRLPWRSRLHYSLMVSYYPTVAISWILGIFVSMLYLVMGQTGIKISGHIWLALYTDVLAVQVLLYAWLRKFNVSPHEESGTIGLPGMFFSMLAAPIYVTALTTTILRRSANFVVTPKGDSASPDRWHTFKKHILWATLIVEFLIYSLITGHSYPGVKVWSFLTLAVCMSPLLMWQIAIWPETKAKLKRRLHVPLHIFSKSSKTKEVELK